MRFENRFAIVTGGANGIGASTAELFAREGATVSIWDMDETGKTTVEKIEAFGGRARYQKVDVRHPEQVNKAIDELLMDVKTIDILINNAGIARDKSLLKMDLEDWNSVIDINLTGVFNCTKAVAGHMKENGYGRIISASSIVGRRGSFGQSNYAASKGGIIAMTKGWAMELGPFGITVNCIAPGFIDTEMTQQIPLDIRQKFIDGIPVKRIGLPQDIAQGYLYLASEEAGFVNGTCLGIDGGAAR